MITLGCGISHRDGWYGCDPTAAEPSCPAGMFCRDDGLCWSSPGDGGGDADVEPDGDVEVGPDVEADADEGEGAEDVGEGDGAECSPEICNGLDDDCDGATDEEVWCVVAEVPTSVDLLGIDGEPAGTAWVVGASGTILRWDGSEWRDVPSGTARQLEAVWSAGEEAWAVGRDGTALVWTGSEWRVEPTGFADDFFGVWGFGTDDLWACGATIGHRTAGSWTAMENSPPIAFHGVWGPAANDVFLVGLRGAIRRWDGTTMVDLDGPRTDLTAIDGLSAIYAWAVGVNGTAVEWDGAAWEVGLSGTAATLYDVRVLSEDEAWAVGRGGTILQWTGESWMSVESPTTEHLYGVWGASPAELWAVGAAGTILRRRS